MKGFLGRIWSLLGIVLSASSIASLCQIGFDIKLALGLSEFLNFYRELVQPIYQVFYKPIFWIFGDFRIPDWIMDAQTLSIVVSSIYVRAKSASRVNGEVIYFKSLTRKIVMVFTLGLTMIGLLFLPVILIGMFMLPLYYVNQLRWNKHLKWYQHKKVLQNVYMVA
ncbi:MAG: hypothetical protein AB3N18_12215, partial [Allomuricauda sp.]